MENDYQIIENEGEQFSGFFALLLEIANRENMLLDDNIQNQLETEKNS